MPLPAPVRGLRAAFIFLTRLPVGGRDYRPDDWRWASAWFPVVGLALGAALGVLWGWMDPLSPLVRALLVVAAGLLITGAMHEDGLADTADALGGSTDRARLFAILKDSRLGTYGVAALCLSVLLRAGLLAELDEGAPVGLALAHMLARLPPVWLMAVLPYVTAEGVAKSRQVTQAGWPQAVIAAVVPLAAMFVWVSQGRLQLEQSATVMLLLLGSGLLCGLRFRARAGGITGDFLGAAEQMGELSILLALCAV